MSKDTDEKGYEGIAFEGFINILCCKPLRKPTAIPTGFENLTAKELSVLAYLEEVSTKRRTRREQSADVCVVVENLKQENDNSNGSQASTTNTSPQPKIEVAQTDISCDPEVLDATEMAPENTGTGDAAEPSTYQHENSLAFSPRTTQEEHEASPVPDVGASEGAASLTITDIDAAGACDDPATDEDSSMIIGPGGIPKLSAGPSQPEPERINLRNGRARKLYTANLAGYTAVHMSDDGGTGLQITAQGEVLGTAPEAGEYVLTLEAIKRDKPVGLQARLTVIADPRDLWKEIPSDQTADLAIPDEAFETQTAQAFIVAASKRGRSHAQEGKYRDDHFRIKANAETGWHILVVADGAGSAELSRIGSKIACDTVIELLPDLLSGTVDPGLEGLISAYDGDPESCRSRVRQELLYPVLPKIAKEAALAIEAHAASLERPSQDFATTIVIAVSRKFADRWFTASFTVGDGGIAIFDADTGHVEVLCRPDSGEFAGQTRFLTPAEFQDEADVMGRIFVDFRPGFTVLTAMTDGITDPKFPTDNDFADPAKWRQFWQDDLIPQVMLHPDNPDIQTQMLDWLDFWSRGNHDDRTIALMLPQPTLPIKMRNGTKADQGTDSA